MTSSLRKTHLRDPYDFSLETYKGVSIFHNHFEWAPCIHLQLMVMTGASDDPIGLEGLSHFLEHLPFDGSAAFPSIEAIKTFAKDKLLDSFNAWTSHKATGYHARFLPKQAQAAIAGIGDIVFRPLLTDTDVERERSIITEESWDDLKNEKYIAYIKKQIRNVYRDHSFGRYKFPFGWPETVAKIEATDIGSWHRRHYHRGNLVFVLGGAVEDQHLAYVRELIDAVPEGIRTPAIAPPSDWPAPLERRSEFRSEDIGHPQNQASIMLYRIRPTNREAGPLGDAAMDALQEILFTELRDNRALVYGVDVGSTSSTDLTEFHISLSVEDENLAEAESAVLEELGKFTEGEYREVFEREKQIALEQLEAKEYSTGAVVNEAGHDIENFGKLLTVAEEYEKTLAATHDQAVALMAETFDRDTLGTLLVRP